MWETPIYLFEEEIMDDTGKIVQRPFYINVTYSAPRNLDDPKKALMGVFTKITEGKIPEKTDIIDIGAAKLRNTLWLLEKGFNVWAVEFPELVERLPSAKEKWERAETYPNFHSVVFPSDFINLKKKFDFVLLINVINVMPIPLERFILLSLCRDKIKDKGYLLWHNWRGLSVGGQSQYSEENAFIDGYIKGGPNHSFYVEYNRIESHEILYSVGFSFNKDMALHRVPSNSCYSYVFDPTHEILISEALDRGNKLSIERTSDEVMELPETVSVLDLYLKELEKTPTGNNHAHKYHRLSSRIFYYVFRNLIANPIIEREINEGRGRIDITYKNRNKEGIFKDFKDLRDIPCPEIMVECKNYENDLTNEEYAQLNDRLSPHRGMLGFLLCRDKIDPSKVIKHCHDRYKGGNNRYIIVFDDGDLIELAKMKLNEEDSDINYYVEEKIKEIID